MTTYYLTKYALSDSIVSVDIADSTPHDPGHRPQRTHIWQYADSHSYVSHKGILYRIGTDAFASWDDAVENAKKRRDRKIASLTKQIDRLSNLSF